MTTLRSHPGNEPVRPASLVTPPTRSQTTVQATGSSIPIGANTMLDFTVTGQMTVVDTLGGEGMMFICGLWSFYANANVTGGGPAIMESYGVSNPGGVTVGPWRLGTLYPNTGQQHQQIHGGVVTRIAPANYDMRIRLYNTTNQTLIVNLDDYWSLSWLQVA